MSKENKIISNVSLNKINDISSAIRFIEKELARLKIPLTWLPIKDDLNSFIDSNHFKPLCFSGDFIECWYLSFEPHKNPKNRLCLICELKYKAGLGLLAAPIYKFKKPLIETNCKVRLNCSDYLNEFIHLVNDFLKNEKTNFKI